MDPRLEKDGDAAVIGDGYEGGPGTGGGAGRLSTPVPMVPVVSLFPQCHQSLAHLDNGAPI